MKTSVVTISLNAVSTIETTLSSVAQQTYPDVEHVIIDGGSTDGTMDVVARYREHIGYSVSEPDEGLYPAMNKGIAAATGDVLFFLNADDRFCDVDVVASAVAAFESAPTLDIVYGDLMWQTKAGLIPSYQPATITREHLARVTVYHQSIFARRSVFAATGGFSEQYKVVSDYEWMIKVFLRNRHPYQHIPKPIAVVGTGGRSWTTKWESERLDVMSRYFTTGEILRERVLPQGERLLNRRFPRQMKRVRRLLSNRSRA